MFSTLRTRFGIPGVISVIALVFAMLGGAYAANNSSDGGKATASAKAKKGPRGPKGPQGDTGPAGPQGAAGAPGAKGDAGANGSNGATGPTGLQGNKGATGLQGAPGATGFSGFTDTLPPGKTETGTWGGEFREEKSVAKLIPISFSIPLTEGAEGKAFYLNEEETEEVESSGEPGQGECAGSVAKPTAPPGKLCVYTELEADSYVPFAVFPLGEFEEGYRSSGAYLQFFSGSPGSDATLQRRGTWAVTAPTS